MHIRIFNTDIELIGAATYRAATQDYKQRGMRRRAPSISFGGSFASFIFDDDAGVAYVFLGDRDGVYYARGDADYVEHCLDSCINCEQTFCDDEGIHYGDVQKWRAHMTAARELIATCPSRRGRRRGRGG